MDIVTQITVGYFPEIAAYAPVSVLQVGRLEPVCFQQPVELVAESLHFFQSFQADSLYFLTVIGDKVRIGQFFTQVPSLFYINFIEYVISEILDFV